MTQDKIYLCADAPRMYDWSNEPFEKGGNVEYIRKDTLLEWLKKEYETISWYYEKMKHVTGCVGDNSSSGKAEAYKQIIDKIESL